MNTQTISSGGTYSVCDPRVYGADSTVMQFAVEGLRPDWQQRLIATALLLHMPKHRRNSKAARIFQQGFIAALKQLSGEEQPPAVCRSLPIIRFQKRLNDALYNISCTLEEQTAEVFEQAALAQKGPL